MKTPLVNRGISMLDLYVDVTKEKFLYNLLFMIFHFYHPLLSSPPHLSYMFSFAFVATHLCQ
jgi:hypothetical protein